MFGSVRSWVYIWGSGFVCSAFDMVVIISTIMSGSGLGLDEFGVSSSFEEEILRCVKEGISLSDMSSEGASGFNIGVDVILPRRDDGVVYD